MEDTQPSSDTNLANLNYTERIVTLIQRRGSIVGSLRCTVFRVRGTLQG